MFEFLEIVKIVGIFNSTTFCNFLEYIFTIYNRWKIVVGKILKILKRIYRDYTPYNRNFKILDTLYSMHINLEIPRGLFYPRF